jgi:uncharacterized membrane protein
MNNRGSLLAATAAGAGLTFLLDPARGARRRARIRDRMAHATAVTRRAIGMTTRDAIHRTYGTAASVRGALRRGDVDDEVLVERVRAKLGRNVSHPHAIDVAARDGVVTLEGPILTGEAPGLLRATGRVRGVRDVIDALERHDEPGHVPSLQGGRTPAGDRLDALQHHWSPTTRCMAWTAGAGLMTAGVARRDIPGVIAAFAGAVLIARAATNQPLAQLAGTAKRRHAVQVQKAITINASVGEVYAFWAWYENFPRFMSRVLEVRADPDGRRSHWRVAGPAGVPVEFDAEVTRATPNQRIEWRTLPGSPVAHAGVVQFEPTGDARTRVQIRMSYDPPAGWLGHGVAAAFGVDPKQSMDADLARMKTLIETGNAPHDAAKRERD